MRTSEKNHKYYTIYSSVSQPSFSLCNFLHSPCSQR